MKTRYIYVGAYGNKYRPAAVPYIGYLFRGEAVEYDDEEKTITVRAKGLPPGETDPAKVFETVEATEQAMSVLLGLEFKVDQSCRQKMRSGDYCPNDPSADSQYCEFHLKLELSKTVTSARVSA